MKVYPNIFSNNPLDRASDLRSDQSWVKNCLNNKDAKICLFWKGKTFVSMHKNLTLANDLEYKYATNAPTTLVEGMTVAGK